MSLKDAAPLSVASGVNVIVPPGCRTAILPMPAAAGGYTFHTQRVAIGNGVVVQKPETAIDHRRVLGGRQRVRNTNILGVVIKDPNPLAISDGEQRR